MNRVARAIILSVAAFATVASTVELASAGDRYWRKQNAGRHHLAKPWKTRIVVGGVAAGIVAGAIVASRPRVIYRDDPVIVDQGPAYDRESAYDDDTVYADPDEDFGRRIDRDDAQVPGLEPEDYAAPRYQDGDDQSYDEQSTIESQDGYFPDRPQERVERKRKSETPKKATRDEVAAAGIKPWTKQWTQWCSGRFSSFNPQNGTYLGYDQKRHFCKAG